MPDADTDVVDARDAATPISSASADAVAPQQLLFAPHPLKLVLLGATTAGAYVGYWLYRNWWAIRVIEQRPGIMPVWRAGFFPLWVCSCLQRLARICGRPPGAARLGAMASTLVFWALVLSWFGGPPVAWLSWLLGLPLLPVNARMRRHKQALGLPRARRERFTVWNWLWLVPVGTLQGLAVAAELLVWLAGRR